MNDGTYVSGDVIQPLLELVVALIHPTPKKLFVSRYLLNDLGRSPDVLQ